MTELPPISRLLPHAEPMCFLQRLLYWDEQRVRAWSRIEPGHPFLRRESVAAVVGIEYLAQACALLLGIRAHLRGGRVSSGLLLGSRQVDLVHDGFPAGAELESEAELVWEDGRNAQFECRLWFLGQLAISARLNVLRVEHD